LKIYKKNRLDFTSKKQQPKELNCLCTLHKMATNYTTVQGHGAVVMIHPDHVGFVAGKRFTTLSAIGRDTHTRIQVGPKLPTNMVPVTIGGRSPEDVTEAYNRVMCVAREAESRTPRVAGMSSAMTELNIIPMMVIECKIEVAQEDVGMVLGARGATLRKTGTDTWTWIKFFKATEKTGATFSVRGFLQTDVDEAVKRIYSIAQESYNRRSGGPRHHRDPKAHEPMKMDEKAVFKMAPVPQSKRVSFKVKSSSVSQISSPTYTPTSPHTPVSA
tara:strand:- start:141 stop:959 length:819 start_codon:yes stop_codon:yes gene_type:complete